MGIPTARPPPVTIFTYPFVSATPPFPFEAGAPIDHASGKIKSVAPYLRSANNLSYTRTLEILRRELGPHYPLEKLWERHAYFVSCFVMVLCSTSLRAGWLLGIRGERLDEYALDRVVHTDRTLRRNDVSLETMSTMVSLGGAKSARFLFIVTECFTGGYPVCEPRSYDDRRRRLSGPRPVLQGPCSFLENFEMVCSSFHLPNAVPLCPRGCEYRWPAGYGLEPMIRIGDSPRHGAYHHIADEYVDRNAVYLPDQLIFACCSVGADRVIDEMIFKCTHTTVCHE